MKNLKLFIFLAAISILFYSCSKNEKQSTTPDKDTTVKKETVGDPLQKISILEGTWISTDDAKYSVQVKGNTWLELYDGEELDKFFFGFGDTCLANQDAKTNPNGKYITVFDSDGNRCYYIIKVNDSKLELSYMGRGNTLSYRKKNN